MMHVSVIMDERRHENAIICVVALQETTEFSHRGLQINCKTLSTTANNH